MTAPAGCIALAQEYLRDTLAACATFQTLVGHAGDAASAGGHVYHDGLPMPADGKVHTLTELQTYRPYAVLTTDPESGMVMKRNSTGTFAQSGRLFVKLVRDTPDGELEGQMPSADAILTWKNTIGQIIDELCVIAGSQAAGYLIFHQIEIGYGPYPSRPKYADAEGNWQGVLLVVEY